MHVYLDYAATTPLEPLVLEAMLPYFTDGFGNPSSLHAAGQRARRAVEEARERVAAAIHARPQEIIFTSGATEADNHALRAFSGSSLLTSPLEHAAVLTTARHLESSGHAVSYAPPNSRGEIMPEAVREALQPGTGLAAFMLVNNETGVITDVPAISDIVHAAGALLFCDAVQALGTLHVDVRALGVDMLSLSGHKIYGPKGVGVLYVREGLELPPFLLGGEQERGRRAGTLNVPAIVGMGVAAELAGARFEEDAVAITANRNYLKAQLLKVGGVTVNGAGAPRGPKHLNVSVAGVDGEALLMGLDRAGVAASAGSACAAGTLEPSHVLLAMGLSEQRARSSLRFSLGRGLTKEALSYAASSFAEVVARCRLYAA